MSDENKMQGNVDWLKSYNLALEDKVGCDTNSCTNEAEYYAQVKCCNAVIISCEECIRKAYKLVLWMLKQNKAVVCEECNQSNDPRGWLSRPSKLSLLDVDKSE